MNLARPLVNAARAHAERPAVIDPLQMVSRFVMKVCNPKQTFRFDQLEAFSAAFLSNIVFFPTSRCATRCREPRGT